MAKKKTNPDSSPKTVAVVSLGCPKNTVDSEVMLGKLALDRYLLVQEPAQAEIVIVNTCGFIEAAKKESIDTILEVAKFRKNGRLKSLVVGGCLAQRYGTELKKELPEIDVLFGLNDLEKIPDLIKNSARRQKGKKKESTKSAVSMPIFTHGPQNPPPLLPGSMNEATYVYDASAPRLLITPSHYAYVKISEGCDLPCSYCVIPRIRGQYRSRAMEDIEKEARQLASQGVKEICLVAQDSTWYGADRYGKPRITELLAKLGQVEGLEWLRLHYLYPSRVTNEMLKVMADNPRICPYFDVPVQHASNRILKSMKRIGDRKVLEGMIRRIRAKIPRSSIRSSFIIGFPGESDWDFKEILDFLRTSPMDYVGFFPYSREENTPAAGMDKQVPEDVKKSRLAEACRVQEEIAEKSHQRWVGERLKAVIESLEKGGEVQGRTESPAPEVDGVVLVEGLSEPRAGQWVDVEITHAMQQDLIGKVI